MNTSDTRLRLSLFSITWPILIENLLRTSFLSLDTLMLSNYSEYAVAAMSLVHTIGFFVQLLYLMVGVGANILISQHLGAKKESEAGIVGIGSLVLTIYFSIAISLTIALSAGPIIELFGLEPIVEQSAVHFIQVYGSCSIFLSLNIVFSSILRSWGHSRDPMIVNIACLGLTMVLNWLGLFGPFRFSAPGLFESGTIWGQRLVEDPSLIVDGVTWVAFSTVLGQMTGAVALFVLLLKRKDVDMPFGEIRRVPATVYRKVLKVGVPSAGETLSYNLAHLVILSMVAAMGTKVLAAYGILIAILRYVFITGISIGMGTQIKVGYFIGANQHRNAYRAVLGYFGFGFGFTVIAVVSTYWLSNPIFSLFTADPTIVRIAHAAYFVALFHEPGRTLNTIVTPALKGAGDVVFPVIMALIMMWGIGVVGAYVLGVYLGLGLMGIWIGLALDEWIRGMVMLVRWKSMVWVTKRLV